MPENIEDFFEWTCLEDEKGRPALFDKEAAEHEERMATPIRRQHPEEDFDRFEQFLPKKGR